MQNGSGKDKNASVEELERLAKEIRKRVLEIIYNSGASHIGSSYSCIELLLFLYFKILNINPENPFDPERDRFILSKGHAAAGFYAVLSKRGFCNNAILDNFYKDGKMLPGHASRQCVPGVEISSGSLGHGLPIASGMALVAKKDNRSHRVFALLSDGECQEGSTWEAALFSGHHKLDNLVAIVDYNKIQAMGRTNEILNLEPFAEKWKSFGWEVKEVNGHDFKELESCFSIIPFVKGKPSLVIAHTIKGKGISFIEDQLISHYKKFNEEEYKRAMEELEK